MLIFPTENKDPDAVEVLILAKPQRVAGYLESENERKPKQKLTLSKLQITICPYVSL